MRKNLQKQNKNRNFAPKYPIANDLLAKAKGASSPSQRIVNSIKNGNKNILIITKSE